MLTEAQVRDLLHRAAGTVDVDPVGPVIAPGPRRPWLITSAALAVAATVIAVFVAVGLDRDGDGNSSPGPVDTPTPSADELPPSPHRYELDEDQMPLFFGWTVDDARAELESRGYAVQVHEALNECGLVGGRVSSTEPTVGTRLDPGQTVALVTPGDSTVAADCAGPSHADQKVAWSLIDFAEGRGPAPDFAEEVTLWLGNRFSRTITAEEARDQDNWVVCSDNGVVCASALNDLVENKYFLMGEEPRPAYLQLSRAESSSSWAARPSILDGRQALIIEITTPTDGRMYKFPSVDVFEHDGVIDAVGIWTGLNADGSAGVEVPDVVGMPAPQAQFALMEAGFGWEAEVEQIEGCDEPGIVLDQEPDGGALVHPGTRPTLSVCRSDDLSADADGVGRSFVEFARGTSTLDRTIFADKVDLYLGNEFVKTISNADAYQSDPWKVCPDAGYYAEAICPFSAVDVVRNEERARIVYTAGHPELGACATGAEQSNLPNGRFVVVGIAEPDSCMNNWNVELYYGADGLITAVNLLLGSP